jgi:hypothetical protein
MFDRSCIRPTLIDRTLLGQSLGAHSFASEVLGGILVTIRGQQTVNRKAL